jgi:hypothetical protein
MGDWTDELDKNVWTINWVLTGSKTYCYKSNTSKFLTDDSQLFFSNYTLYIFLFVLIKNLLLNIRALKEKTKNVF